MQKKGVSEVVTTILFVLLSIVAVVIVGAFVRTQLTGTTSQAALSKACLDLNLEATNCKYVTIANGTNYNASVNYRRGGQKLDFELRSVSIIFEFPDGTTSIAKSSNIPEVLEIKKETVLLTAIPSKVSATGVLVNQGGKEYTCEVYTKVDCEAA